MITFVCLLSALVLLTIWVWPAPHGTAPTRRTVDARRPQRRERGGWYGDDRVSPLLQGEAVFAHWSGPHQVALDCLLSPGTATDAMDGAQNPPEPAQVRVHGATLGWTAGSLADLPVRWLQDDRRVFVNVIARGHDRLIARVTDGYSYALLHVDELVAAAVGDKGGAG